MTRRTSRWAREGAFVLALSALWACKPGAPPSLGVGQPSSAPASKLSVPVEYFKLGNGLRVVFSPDHSAPTVVVAVYYDIGFRNEPRERTGFAHLFEHMMFQGSRSLGKMEFIRLIQGSGGILNGSTRYDFTNYFEVLPAEKLEIALWAEADRMATLEVSQDNLVNQQKVVKSEVRVNVLNRPYGGFPWLDLPQHANTNWFNAHNFYGDLRHLDAASLEDVRAFFRTYYVPNNAVLVLTGDFEPAAARALVEKHFGPVAAGKLAPKPDLTEPEQTREKRAHRVDPKIKRPALAVAYHMPERKTPEHAAMILLDQILLQGDDALLSKALVRGEAVTGSVSGGINHPLGNAHNYNGPMLWTFSLHHDATALLDRILAAIDRAVARVKENLVSHALLARARLKARAALYEQIGVNAGFGRADLLASFALFDDDPSRINRIDAELAAVTPEVLRATAQRFLRTENRTVFELRTAGQKGAQ